MPVNDPPYPIICRTTKYHSRKRPLLLGMMTASTKAASFPNIDSIVDSILNMKLRKSRGKDGKLNICKMSDF